MLIKDRTVSQRFLGVKGEEYARYFTASRDSTRSYQCRRYFAPYVDAEDVVLDLGCADGLFLRILPAARRIGVEVNASTRQLCEKMSVSTGIYVELVRHLSEINTESVDVAISNHSLEHVLDPFGTLQELWRVLRPGGRLVIVTPFDDWRSRIHRTWRPHDLDNHLYTWSPLNLGNLLSEAAFCVEAVEFRRFTASSRFSWVCRLFGDKLFHLAGWIVAHYRHKGEVFARARKMPVLT